MNFKKEETCGLNSPKLRKNALKTSITNSVVNYRIQC